MLTIRPEVFKAFAGSVLVYPALGELIVKLLTRDPRVIIPDDTSTPSKLNFQNYESQHRNLTLEKKILSPLLSGLELATFRSRVRRSTNKLSRLSSWLIMN